MHRFWFTLPKRAEGVAKESTTCKQVNRRTEKVQRQKVLVVENDPVTLLTLKDRLEYEGSDVETER